jgi:hypothetical protein
MHNEFLCFSVLFLSPFEMISFSLKQKEEMKVKQGMLDWKKHVEIAVHILKHR